MTDSVDLSVIQPPPWTFTGASGTALTVVEDQARAVTDNLINTSVSTSQNAFNTLLNSATQTAPIKLPVIKLTGVVDPLLYNLSLGTASNIDWVSSPDAVPNISISYTRPTMESLEEISLGTTSPPPEPDLTYNTPPSPDIIGVSPEFPDRPPSVGVGSIGGLSVGAAPTFNVPAPNIGSVQAPTAFSKSVPSMGALPDRQYPSAPVKNLPVSPTMRGFSLPKAPEILSFEFSGVFTEELGAPPDLSFNYAEVVYDSNLLNALKNKIFDLVHTARQTGLNEVTQQKILDDGHIRTNSACAGFTNQVINYFNRMGWESPDDFLEKVNEAQEFSVAMGMSDLQNDNIILSELEQQSFIFSIGKAVELEGRMIDLHNKIQQRSFEAAKAIVKASIAIYRTKVTYFNTAVLLYEAQATVYKSRIQAALAQVELYKAQVEGQKLIGELNTQAVELYKAQIEAVISLHEIYKAELEAVKTKLEGDGLKIKQFEMAIEAFSAEIQAKALEYDGYKAAMTGEELKAKIFDSLVKAYGSQIEAFSTGVEAQVLKLDAEIKANIEAPLQISEQAVKEFVAIIGAEGKYLKALSKSDDAAVDIFSTLIDAEKGRVENLADVFSAEVSAYDAVNRAVESKVKIASSINDTLAEIYKSEAAGSVSDIESTSAIDSLKVAIIKALTSLDLAIANIGVANYRSGAAQTNAAVTTSAEQSAAGAANRSAATAAVAAMEMALDIAEIEVTKAIEEKEIVVKQMIAAAQAQAQGIAAKASTFNDHRNLSMSKTDSTAVSLGHYSFMESDVTTIQGD